MAQNPTYQTMGSMAHTYQTFMSYIGLMDEPYPIEIKKGLDDLYIAAFKYFKKPEVKKIKTKSKSKKSPTTIRRIR